MKKPSKAELESLLHEKDVLLIDVEDIKRRVLKFEDQIYAILIGECPLEDAPEASYKDGVMEAYGMLQIDAEFRDIEWEDDRREWIKKWGMVLVPEGGEG